MSFPNNLLIPSTWRHVGLGLSTVIFGLGALAMVSPTTGADALGVNPKTPEGHEINNKAMAWLGIRDVAAASALFWFHSEGKQREMGVLIAAWTLVCITDTYIAAQGPRGVDGGIWALVGGAVVIALGGLGLAQS